MCLAVIFLAFAAFVLFWLGPLGWVFWWLLAGLVVVAAIVKR